MKRISLSAYDAEHAYEWLRMYWREDDQTFGGCFDGERIGHRLEQVIGPAAVRRIARLPALARTKKKHAKKAQG